MSLPLTFEEKYNILGTKDSSFEGVFITAVKTTGIFCRPSCRARRPNRENVIFYKTATEAIKNGYRSCKICKPLEQINATPPYIQSLINEVIEQPQNKITDKTLLKRSIQPHNIRRWFKANYNITFHAFQRMICMNDAFTKINNGNSITDTAFQSGYESLSGFNDQFSSIFGRSASKLKTPNIIHFTKLATPIGEMFACATKKGLCLLEFTDRKNIAQQLHDLKNIYKAVILPGKSVYLDQTKLEINEYFNGKRKKFDVCLDPFGTDFRKLVWNELIKIPFGQTCSYKDQSINMEMPKAIRAIASANGANKIAIIIPCHRVIGSDGSLTGYAGGIHRKKWLLKHEGAITT